MAADPLTVSLLLDLLVRVDRMHVHVVTLNADLREHEPVHPTDSMDALSNDISAPPPGELPTTHARPVQVVMHPPR